VVGLNLTRERGARNHGPGLNRGRAHDGVPPSTVCTQRFHGRAVRLKPAWTGMPPWCLIGGQLKMLWRMLPVSCLRTG